MKKQQVIMIVGPARHGKDTLANSLAKLTGTPVKATSDLIYREMAEEMAVTINSQTFVRENALSHGSPAYGSISELDRHTEWLAEQICTFLKGLPKDGTEDKAKGIRKHLAMLGSYRCIGDPIYWTRRLLKSGVRVIPGIRRLPELVMAVDHIKAVGMEPVTVWITRPHGPSVANDNLEISPDSWEFDTMITVDEGAHELIDVAARGVLAGEKTINIKKD